MLPLKKASSQISKYLFDIKDYAIVEEINKGGHGVIILVRCKLTGALYATKTNPLSKPKQCKHYIPREVRILIQVHHPTIILCHGFSFVDFDNRKNITILMDYMKNGSLGDLIKKVMKGEPPNNYNNTKKQIILIGVARGMMVLHKHHIIHRDLKPDNILLDDNLYPLITDFGISKFFNPYHSMSQSMGDNGTIAYMAPEFICGEPFNTKADVYSFGILMWELLTGKQAYQNFYDKKIGSFQLQKEIVQDGLRPKIEEGSMKKSFQVIIEKCLLKDPKERPTMSEIYKKLSLFIENPYLDLEDQFDDNVIDYEGDDDDENVEDDEIGIDKTFCLDDVDYNEILNYIKKVSVELDSKNQSIKNEEIDQMKKKIDDLQKTNKKQNSAILKLVKNNEKMMNAINDLRKKINDDELSKIKKQILEIQEENKATNDKNKELEVLVQNLNKELIIQKTKVSEIECKNFETSKQNDDVIKSIGCIKHEIKKWHLINQKLQDKAEEHSNQLQQQKELNEELKNLATSLPSHEHQIVDINELPNALKELQTEIEDSIESEKQKEIENNIKNQLNCILSNTNKDQDSINESLRCLKHEIKLLKQQFQYTQVPSKADEHSDNLDNTIQQLRDEYQTKFQSQEMQLEEITNKQKDQNQLINNVLQLIEKSNLNETDNLDSIKQQFKESLDELIQKELEGRKTPTNEQEEILPQDQNADSVISGSLQEPQLQTAGRQTPLLNLSEKDNPKEAIELKETLEILKKELEDSKSILNQVNVNMKEELETLEKKIFDKINNLSSERSNIENNLQCLKHEIKLLKSRPSTEVPTNDDALQEIIDSQHKTDELLSSITNKVNEHEDLWKEMLGSIEKLTNGSNQEEEKVHSEFKSSLDKLLEQEFSQTKEEEEDETIKDLKERMNKQDDELMCLKYEIKKLKERPIIDNVIPPNIEERSTEVPSEVPHNDDNRLSELEESLRCLKHEIKLLKTYASTEVPTNDDTLQEIIDSQHKTDELLSSITNKVNIHEDLWKEMLESIRKLTNESNQEEEKVHSEFKSSLDKLLEE